MQKLKWFIIVDAFLVFTFLIAFLSAIVVWRIIPANGIGFFWGLSSTHWGEIHMFVNLFFIILFIAHMLLHWVCIKECYPNGNGKN